jgi:hypothetical protein
VHHTKPFHIDMSSRTDSPSKLPQARRRLDDVPADIRIPHRITLAQLVNPISRSKFHDEVEQARAEVAGNADAEEALASAAIFFEQGPEIRATLEFTFKDTAKFAKTGDLEPGYKRFLAAIGIEADARRASHATNFTLAQAKAAFTPVVEILPTSQPDMEELYVGDYVGGIGMVQGVINLLLTTPVMGPALLIMDTTAAANRRVEPLSAMAYEMITELLPYMWLTDFQTGINGSSPPPRTVSALSVHLSRLASWDRTHYGHFLAGAGWTPGKRLTREPAPRAKLPPVGKDTPTKDPTGATKQPPGAAVEEFVPSLQRNECIRVRQAQQAGKCVGCLNPWAGRVHKCPPDADPTAVKLRHAVMALQDNKLWARTLKAHGMTPTTPLRPHQPDAEPLIVPSQLKKKEAV